MFHNTHVVFTYFLVVQCHMRINLLKVIVGSLFELIIRSVGGGRDTANFLIKKPELWGSAPENS